MSTKTYVMYLRKSSESEERQVLSIPAQEREIRELVARHGLSVAGEPIREEMSAKTPGRPRFSEMMAALRVGRADGIVCWHLDRLARNPVDGGSLMWELGEGRIKEIVTPDRTYTGTGDDKLMMSIIFGMATKYSDDLSRNVKRGNREALAVGRWPNRPKLGYVRDHGNGQIVPDPERFDLVTEVWRRRLAGVPVMDILRTATEEMKLRTPCYGRIGGKPLSASQLYRLFGDPFYAGVMVFDGQSYTGGHRAMITWSQFQSVQAAASRGGEQLADDMPDTAVAIKNTREDLRFPYRGLVRCGACGSIVTAEHTTNRHGTTYTYYHCARKRRPYRYCGQPSVQEPELEAQLHEFLGSITIPGPLVRFALSRLDRLERNHRRTLEDVRVRTTARLARIESQLAGLRTLCADGAITALELAEDRERLLSEQRTLREELNAAEEPEKTLEPLRDEILQAKDVIFDFKAGDPAARRELVRRVCSNPTLKDKTLLCEAKKLYAAMREKDTISTLLRGWDSNPQPAD